MGTWTRKKGGQVSDGLPKGHSYPCVPPKDHNLPLKMVSHHTKMKIRYYHYAMSRAHSVGAILSQITLCYLFGMYLLYIHGPFSN